MRDFPSPTVFPLHALSLPPPPFRIFTYRRSFCFLLAVFWLCFMPLTYFPSLAVSRFNYGAYAHAVWVWGGDLFVSLLERFFP